MKDKNRLYLTSIFGLRLLAFLLLLLMSAGCRSEKAMSDQLARVAKDWCLTIRASQVLPVYPLTEDLRVGDVFLITSSRKEEIAVYESKGFLPLENQVARLKPKGYTAFYDGSYGIDDTVNYPPQIWLKEKDGWGAAPQAAFPSYSFIVDRGAGLNVGIPVRGISAGLGLLVSEKVYGTVAMYNAFTYGLDSSSLSDLVEIWGKQHISLLKRLVAENSKEALYLRVVNRVYLIGGISVILSAANAKGVNIAGQAIKPVDLYSLGDPKEVKQYGELVKAVNSVLTDLTPGGTLKMASFSGNSVLMTETFSRPLVIGFLSFDVKIQPDGTLGPPLPTMPKLDPKMAVMTELFSTSTSFAHPVMSAHLEVYRGDDYFESGRYSQAFREYRKARKANPDGDWQLRYPQLAASLILTHNVEEGRNMLFEMTTRMGYAVNDGSGFLSSKSNVQVILDEMLKVRPLLPEVYWHEWDYYTNEVTALMERIKE